MCLAFGGAGCKGEARADPLNEVQFSLMACGGQAGQDLPTTFAAGGLVATGELASDHGGAQTIRA